MAGIDNLAETLGVDNDLDDVEKQNLMYSASNRIKELESSLERLIGWRETTELIAPTLGGLLKEMGAAKAVLEKTLETPERI